MAKGIQERFGVILLEEGPGGRAALFDGARDVLLARSGAEVMGALAEAEAARRAGAWIAGWIAYEAGYALEPRLAALMPGGAGPLVCLGVYDGPQDAEPLLARAAVEAGGAEMEPLRPMVSRAEYGEAFGRVKDWIAAGDCYQVNLTFPLETRLRGSSLGLYGALRVRQRVGYGAYCDIGGVTVISRSPELFLRIGADGRIESRPMKGTAPRDGDPVRDAELAEELRASEKTQAENLMIVDLIRNDISRIARVGSVKVPKLFAVEGFATVHQMSSRVVGALAAPVDLGTVMAALFPCGSITGAPKIRAMEIIRAVEPHPRGAYCGAVGWMGPEGAGVWNVAIRTLTVTGTRVVMNVGGGVVQDSTEDGEWEEALWKARYAGVPVIRG